MISDMPTGRGITWLGRPLVGEPLSGRLYPIRVYRNPACPNYTTQSAFVHDREISFPTYPSYPTLSLAYWRGTLWI